MKTRPKTQSKSTSSSIIELVVIIAIALGLALAIQAFVVKPYRIPSGSMEPTLDVGQRVLVNRIATRFSDPHVGEIAVFHPPKDAEHEICGPEPHMVTPGGAACAAPETEHSNVNFIKRVIAGPGDVISIHEGHVIRNGQPETSATFVARVACVSPLGPRVRHHAEVCSPMISSTRSTRRRRSSGFVRYAAAPHEASLLIEARF